MVCMAIKAAKKVEVKNYLLITFSTFTTVKPSQSVNLGLCKLENEFIKAIIYVEKEIIENYQKRNFFIELFCNCSASRNMHWELYTVSSYHRQVLVDDWRYKI